MTGRLNDQQFQQLPMFMSAHEIKATHAPHDRLHVPTSMKEHRPETDNEVWDRKVEEAWVAPGRGDRSLRQVIHDNDGRQSRPMSLNPTAKPPTVIGGHHRIAVMDEEFPDTLMPVVHHTDIKAAKASLHYPYT